MPEGAGDPNDLEKLFVERANARDVEGLVALYEADAILVDDNGMEIVGADQLREFFVRYLHGRPKLVSGVQAAALRSSDLALTSSLHVNGDVSVEIARQAPDGGWLWVIDHFAILKKA